MPSCIFLCVKLKLKLSSYTILIPYLRFTITMCVVKFQEGKQKIEKFIENNNNRGKVVGSVLHIKKHFFLLSKTFCIIHL